MTEKDAKTKWCPMARVAVPVGLTVNRVSTNLMRIADDCERAYFEEQQDNCKCIASACALWVSCSTCWDNLPVDQRHGHCGLIRG